MWSQGWGLINRASLLTQKGGSGVGTLSPLHSLNVLKEEAMWAHGEMTVTCKLKGSGLRIKFYLVDALSLAFPALRTVGNQFLFLKPRSLQHWATQPEQTNPHCLPRTTHSSWHELNTTLIDWCLCQQDELQGTAMSNCLVCVLSCSVTSDSLQPYGLYSPLGSSVHGDSPGKNTGVGCHALLQGIFPTQGSNTDLPHCRWILYRLSPQSALEVSKCFPSVSVLISLWSSNEHFVD